MLYRKAISKEEKDLTEPGEGWCGRRAEVGDSRLPSPLGLVGTRAGWAWKSSLGSRLD